MNAKTLIYLHGFNSASLDQQGNLLVSKEKLLILQRFCEDNAIHLHTPNVDYRDFASLIAARLQEWQQATSQGRTVIFMGSSMGGFASEYLALKTGSQAIMVNPVLSPSQLLLQFVGVSQNYATGQPYSWSAEDCLQYIDYERELAATGQPIQRLVLLDMADELLDSAKTLAKYESIAQVHSFAGGTHGFEHMAQALPMIKRYLQG